MGKRRFRRIISAAFAFTSALMVLVPRENGMFDKGERGEKNKDREILEGTARDGWEGGRCLQVHSSSSSNMHYKGQGRERGRERYHLGRESRDPKIGDSKASQAWIVYVYSNGKHISVQSNKNPSITQTAHSHVASI
ncbi:uncharacterized protein LY89DRAFT_180386 [Mollisia scopiformis]|uniref:Uncharacterized protein n=1 Tax=Mollisia scopiformis TaxID=149040 RepID=A0A194XUH8_MOLSC|nr:uncharacterized protein LY89DRAFT_180386 [Mollisia scopiformis]KUJ23362.1 hypothetical protein LY89DRAFT_180386 [Mollisia scopiformis]